MKLIISYYDSGYWWGVCIINKNSISHYTKNDAPKFVKDIIDKYEDCNDGDFFEWTQAKNFEEVWICDNGSIYYYKQEQNTQLEERLDLIYELTRKQTAKEILDDIYFNWLDKIAKEYDVKIDKDQ